MRICGIDPGTRVLGYGVIESDGRAARLVACEAVAARAALALPQRLCAIEEALTALLARDKPDVVAIEKAYFGRSVTALIALGEGRGVALLCAARLGIEIHEYSPAEIKKAVTGSGGARKPQVGTMVRALLPGQLPEATGADAADAIAAALCHHQRARLIADAGPVARQLGELLGRTRGARGRRGRGR